MSEPATVQALLEPVIGLVHEAGEAIMAVYAEDFDVEHKDDRSPLTAADRAAHGILDAGLVALAGGYPVLSEESAHIPWETRRGWRTYWLVDPLDGTREFVKRNGEFTVNVALIDDDRPVLGVVYAPALGYLAYAAAGCGAFRRAANGQDIALSTRPQSAGPLRVAASRSHLDERTLALLERVGEHERIGLGSSLKFCRIAEGQIDLYPRFGPTSEWDTAAAQCLLEEAGGAVIKVDGEPLRYNTKDSLLNTDFLALASRDLPWRNWV
ncbi:3'(2'),5'-bisphosphate nucleotidase CysQ [Pseudomarimonas salicorniae]|uniref:3'(2'),5'-bisphosphate nucleotidase CysQ n=1 Tax=Pseudomarimonas salicorniae TaxID=2933270 RepID=A0ABT0GEK7_9GAMM|nr:3'(2'),5'-bisphosphate nucleotidase CysQ [Lysobacter sp. CAU 1642]MCK7592787.1 3'(2'),5'-bisphosphate nucleotidase CysQ [Lysobacter sp. CAU 1642]